MYRIIKIDGTELGAVENVNYIKIGNSGCFTTATEKDARGVAYNGVAYNLIGREEITDGDTVVVSMVDSGDYMTPLAKTIEAEQAITELDIANIEAQQTITELELMILGGL